MAKGAEEAECSGTRSTISHLSMSLRELGGLRGLSPNQWLRRQDGANSGERGCGSQAVLVESVGFKA